MKSKEEIEKSANEFSKDYIKTTNNSILQSSFKLEVGYIKGYTKCQEDISKEPFNNFYLRLKRFVSNVQVNDLMNEEEKEMIIHVCNEKLNKQD